LINQRKRVFSGIQPTGYLHVGNYLGAVRNWVAQQDDHDSYYCIVDLHAMTLPWEPGVLRERSVDTAALLMACGLDPQRVTLFMQSHVPAHAELAWVFSCIARMGELRRMVAFKEKSKGETESVGVGLFTYPVLQAADVLLYQAHGVPVGEDQRQHIELMRDIGGRFNSSFGETFVLPEAWIPPAGARIMALDDPSQKMSKSSDRLNASVLLVDEPDQIAKKFKVAVTDSGRDVRVAEDKPAVSNLVTIFALLGDLSVAEVEERFAGEGYGAFKKALGDVVIEKLTPIRERYQALIDDPAEIERLLSRGADKATAAATPTLDLVRERTGLTRR